MSDALLTLTEALKRRLTIVADRDWYERDADSHLQALVEVSLRIDLLSGAVLSHSAVSEKLKHYLVKKSFNKALLFIETGDASE